MFKIALANKPVRSTVQSTVKLWFSHSVN